MCRCAGCVTVMCAVLALTVCRCAGCVIVMCAVLALTVVFLFAEPAMGMDV